MDRRPYRPEYPQPRRRAECEFYDRHDNYIGWHPYPEELIEQWERERKNEVFINCSAYSPKTYTANLQNDWVARQYERFKEQTGIMFLSEKDRDLFDDKLYIHYLLRGKKGNVDFGFETEKPKAVSRREQDYDDGQLSLF